MAAESASYQLARRDHKPRSDLPTAGVERRQTLSPSSRRRLFGYGVAFTLGGAAMLAAAWIWNRSTTAPGVTPAFGATQQPAFGATSLAASPLPPRSHYDLLAMSPDQLAKVDIAVMNLLCAKDLPGAENLDIPAILRQLDEWAAKVRFETERHLYRVKDPRYAEHYANSEARLRAEFIVQCLQEDFGVHYNLERANTPDFRNSQDLFLHGLVGSRNGGTCSSMPLVYTAIGRRLGYPMKLVLAYSHVFCRWDGQGERFNVEAAGNGGVDYPTDDYYRTWPKPISEAAIQRGEYLKSLTPAEEISSFLIDRGMCLDYNGRYPEARAAFAEAHRLMPQSEFHLSRLAIAMRQVFGPPGAGDAHRRQEADAWLQQFMVPEPQPGMPQIPQPGVLPPGPRQPGIPPPGGASPGGPYPGGPPGGSRRP